MDINDLFRHSNKADLEDLIPLKTINNPSEYFHMDDNPELCPDYSQIMQMYGCDIADKCYYCVTVIPELIYFDKDTYVLLEMMGVLMSHTPRNILEKNINEFAKEIKELGLENENVSWKLSSKFKISLLNYYIKHQDVENYKDFIDLYIHSEYGFGKMTQKKIREIFDTPHKKEGQTFINKLPDRVTIYRGEGDKSTSLDKALSWTLNPQTAYFFAIKNSQNTSYLYTAKVKKKDILDYINDRNEEEILVYPENVHLMSKDILYSLDDIKKIYKNEYTNAQFVAFELMKSYNNFLQTSAFAMNSSLHGINHMKRICFLSGLIHEMLREFYRELNDNTLITVMTAGLLHDVGRVDEWNDLGHGKRSAEKYESWFSQYNSDVSLLIQYHDKDDDVLEKYLEHNHVKRKELLWICYGILKDADALDRLRLGWRDLDTGYLRNSISKNLVFVAKQLLNVNYEI